jgi:hypothetical protein
MSRLTDILTSPRVWAIVLSAIIMAVPIFWVAAPYNTTDALNALAALMFFVVSASVGPEPSYINLFGQTKFWTLVVSLVFVFVKAFSPSLAIMETQILTMIGVLGSLSVGTAYRPLNTTLLTPIEQNKLDE